MNSSPIVMAINAASTRLIITNLILGNRSSSCQMVGLGDERSTQAWCWTVFLYRTHRTELLDRSERVDLGQSGWPLVYGLPGTLNRLGDRWRRVHRPCAHTACRLQFRLSSQSHP